MDGWFVDGWFKSKAYSRVKSWWVGQKLDDFGRTYFHDDPYCQINCIIQWVFQGLLALIVCYSKKSIQSK